MMSDELIVGLSSSISGSSSVIERQVSSSQISTKDIGPKRVPETPLNPSIPETQSTEDRSSSTEGPDSPGHSSASSPKIPMMIPAYPGDLSATPESRDDPSNGDLPILPQFAVRVTDNVTKNGDCIKYQIRVWKLNKDKQKDENEAIIIEREYEDFEFLHHTLTTSNRIYGIIIPPLPPRPPADPKESEKLSQTQLGSGNKNMKGDDFENECGLLDRYMQQLLHHPVFGRDRHLAEFLEHKNPPIRAKIKRGGLLAWGAKTFDAATRKSAIDDEDFFVKEREWASLYGSHIKDACDKIYGIMHAQMRLSNQITHLSTLLGASVGGKQGTNGYYNRLCSQFGTCLEEERKGIDAYVANEEASLANYLSLWSSYMDEENAMLGRRTALVVETEVATKSLAKATLAGKAAKTAAALSTKEEKERDLKSATKMAEVEIRRFHQQRLGEMKESLIAYTEGQTRAAQDAHQRLKLCVSKMRQFEMPRKLDQANEHFGNQLDSSKTVQYDRMNMPE